VTLAQHHDLTLRSVSPHIPQQYTNVPKQEAFNTLRQSD
jgi:hypothetical protein